MRPNPARAALAMVALTFFFAGAAFAADSKVQVNADVVHVSQQGDVVDPPELASMKKAFTDKGLAFSSYKRLSHDALMLDGKHASEIALPNHKQATVKLESIHEGTAQLLVTVNGSHTRYTLGREGSLFITAGDFKGGQLVLVLSPATGSKP